MPAAVQGGVAIERWRGDLAVEYKTGGTVAMGTMEVRLDVKLIGVRGKAGEEQRERSEDFSTAAAAASDPGTDASSTFLRDQTGHLTPDMQPGGLPFGTTARRRLQPITPADVSSRACAPKSIRTSPPFPMSPARVAIQPSQWPRTVCLCHQHDRIITGCYETANTPRHTRSCRRSCLGSFQPWLVCHL